MSSGEEEHPLRADPLHELPDAVLVPRRPRPRISQFTNGSQSTSEKDEDNTTKSAFGTGSLDKLTFEREARELVANNDGKDPLIAAIFEKTERSPSPPAGHAFATDIQKLLAATDPNNENENESPPVAAGVVDRSDVTLFPCAPEEGSAAGVYIVRSRRNWAFNATNSQTPTPATNQPSASDEYYHVKRSIADFSWLEERLRAKNQGAIVPSLPSMALLGRITHGYTYESERLRGLQQFLRKVGTHAILSTTDEVLSFLGATGDEAWRKLRREPITYDSSITSVIFGGSGDSTSSNTLQKISNWSEKMMWQAGRQFHKGVGWFLERDIPNADRRKEDTGEARLERLQTYVKELETSLSALRQMTGRVARNRLQEARGVSAMEEAIHRLAKREGGKFGVQLDRVELDIPMEFLGEQNGEANEDQEREMNNSDTSSSITTRLPVARVVDDVFRDYEERARGAQRIMNSRKEEHDAYEHALAVYTKLRDKLDSKTGSMWEQNPNPAQQNRGAGIEQLVKDVNIASTKLNEVRKRYQRVALATTDELRRLRNDMHKDLCVALQALAFEHARQHAAHSIAWASFAEALNEYKEESSRRR